MQFNSTMLKRGLRLRCPNCGEARALQGYLKTVPACPQCGAELGKLRADDMPPWITIILTGHLIGPFIVALSQNTEMSNEAQLAIWIPIILAMIWLMLPRAKGVTLALLWGMEQQKLADATKADHLN